MWGVNWSFCSFTFLHVKDEQKTDPTITYTPYLHLSSSLLQISVQLWWRNTETHAGTQVSCSDRLTVQTQISAESSDDKDGELLIFLVFLFQQTESDSAGQHLPDQNELAERGRFIRSVRSFINSISYRPSPWIYRSYGLINRLIEDRSTSCVF